MVQVPRQLIESVKAGRCVLFLGAGASFGAKNGEGKRLPSANELRDLLADQFLDGKHKSSPLHAVGDWAIGRGGLRDVEFYIRDIFQNGVPTGAHRLLPEFRWPKIFTTNYDCLVEEAYRVASRSSYLHSSTSDFDVAAAEAEAPGHVELVKLHGCISRVSNPNCPLILTTDHYSQHKRGRERLFTRLADRATQYHFLFIGHSLADPDIVEHTTSLPPDSRSHYFLVAPDLHEDAIHRLEQKGITGVVATFAQFMEALATEIPKAVRDVSQHSLSVSHPIEKRFTLAGASCSIPLAASLATNLTYIDKEFVPPTHDPEAFFKGAAKDFEGHGRGLVIPRDGEDDFLQSILLDMDSGEPTTSLILGPAGSGKSVLLQSLALQAAQTFDRMVAYHVPGTPLAIESIREILSKTAEPLMLFVDNAGDHGNDLLQLTRLPKPELQRLHLVLAERENEAHGARLMRLGPDYVKNLRRVSRREAEFLVEKLAISGQLGELAQMALHERAKRIVEEQGARGDLLVAVYNATHGASLEDQLISEYEGIASENGKRIYLTICTLHRLNVRVRAGTVNRIHGISYDRFKQDFLDILSGIVFDEEEADGDIYYRTRHPVIADIVFSHVLVDEERRLDALLQCIAGIQSGYPSDELALRKLVNHDAIKDFFSNPEMAHLYIDKLLKKLPTDGFAHHQAAVYEFSYEGDLDRAQAFLKKAKELDPDYSPIAHSECHVLFLLGERETEPSRKEHYFRLAEASANALIDRGGSPYPYHTLIRVLTNRLYRLADQGETAEVDVAEVVERAEQLLSVAMEKYVDDERILRAESELADALGDDDRVQKALARALRVNPRKGGVARALARIFSKNGDRTAATECLEGVLKVASTDRATKIALAELLLVSDENGSRDRIRSLVETSRSVGGQLSKVEVLYGRILFSLGRQNDGVAIFRELRRSVRGAGKSWRLYPWPTDVFGKCTGNDPYAGAWVETTEFGRVFVPREVLSAGLSESIAAGLDLRLRVAFNSYGPVAVEASARA